MSGNKQIDVEKLIDSMLEDVVPAVSDERAREELTEPEEEITFSPEHEKRMRKLFRQERRRVQGFRPSKRLVKVAVLLLIVGALGACVMSGQVNAWLVRVQDFFVEVTQKKTSFDYEKDAQGDTYSTDKLSLDYIPAGFELKESVSKVDGLRLFFEKDELYFDVSLNSQTGNKEIDSENADVKKIVINGRNAVLSTKENKNILIWNDGEYSFQLIGNISESEIVKIAENLKK